MSTFREILTRDDYLLFSGRSTDVTLIVGGLRFPAHRAILGSSSSYFREILRGAGRRREIALGNLWPSGFRNVLVYIYRRQFNPNDFNARTILRTLHCALRCKIEHLETVIFRYFKENVSADNVCEYFKISFRMNLDYINDLCKVFLEFQAEAVLKNDGFLQLTKDALLELLPSHKLCAAEISIFQGVQRWCTVNALNGDDWEEIFSHVRLNLISYRDLANIVEVSGLVSEERMETVSAEIEWLHADQDEQIANIYGLHGPLRKKVDADIRDDTFRYRFRQSDNPPYSIVLSAPSIVNYFKFRFVNVQENPYYYYAVDVSADLKEWYRIIDYWEHPCTSVQEHVVEPQLMHQIRIYLAYSSELVEIFEDFEVGYCTKRIERRNGFYIPKENVAIASNGAEVIACSGGFNECIGGDPDLQNEMPGWTWHRVGAGAIIIRLPQPYIVDSIAFGLKQEQLMHGYTYYVEVSENGNEWIRVAEVHASSAFAIAFGAGIAEQRVVFEPISAIFIKLVGSSATETKEFCIRDFKCPSIE